SLLPGLDLRTMALTSYVMLTTQPGVQGLPGEPGQCPASCESIRGPPGEVGLPGIVGPRGLPGTVGMPGMKGQKGDKGEGHAGANGLNGEKGDVGMKGPPGPCSPAIQSAFSARLADLYPVADLPIPFTSVIYNMQFHYDPFTGIYKAPVNGTYVFSYHLVVFTRVLKVGLFHNFKPIVKSTELASLGSVSQQVVLHLSMGDEVWLQVRDTTSNGMYANSEASSTFSGFLLYPDSCDVPLSRELSEPIDGTYTWGELEAPATPAP
uniref:C1q domain-containing protein n=1 Tax=Pygocentrus nattereri TaxID=42514 RepID=A0A3B4C5Y6_PYGNA